MAPLLVQRQGPLHPFEQCGALNRLFQEIYGTGLHRLYGHGNIAVSGEEDDGNAQAARVQRRLNFKPVHAWHGHVQQQAARAVGLKGRQESGAVGMGFHLQVGRLQQLGQRIAHRGVVVDDKYGGVHGANGRTKWKMPPGLWGSTHSRPP